MNRMDGSSAMPTHAGEDLLSVVVVTYRTGVILAQCLETLLAQTVVGELLVVNNGNDATTNAYLSGLAERNPKLRLVDPGRNIGFAAACNLGAARACYGLLAFVNPDCLVPPGTFEKILAVLGDRSDAWLCGGRLLNVDGSEQRGGRREVLTPWRAFVELTRLDWLFPHHPYFRRLHLYQTQAVTEVVEIPTVSGAFMVMPKHRFEAVGGMDDNMFLHVDDADLCIRVAQAGGKVLYCGNAPIYHHRSTSDAPHLFVEWHKTRSSICYFRKHFRQTYPSWALTALSVVLWLRFAATALRCLPSDAIGAATRSRRRRAAAQWRGHQS